MISHGTFTLMLSIAAGVITLIGYKPMIHEGLKRSFKKNQDPMGWTICSLPYGIYVPAQVNVGAGVLVIFTILQLVSTVAVTGLHWRKAILEAREKRKPKQDEGVVDLSHRLTRIRRPFV